MVEQVADGVQLVLAPNPGPMTLDGTNTYVIDGRIVIDPGPADEGHLATVAALGDIELILVTHSHFDHTEGVSRLVELTGAQSRGPGGIR